MSSASPSDQGPTRPNLLVIMADQHAAHALSCAGATHLTTPALDALAADGTRFTRAYTTFPLCVPARASMITGLHPHELGVMGNVRGDTQEPGRDPASLGHRLRALGYDTAYAGKWHALQASVSAEDGFEVVTLFGDRGLAEAAGGWLRGRAGQERPFAFVVSFDDPHSICEFARRQPMPYGEVRPVPPVRDLPPLPANHGPAAYEPEALRHEQRRAAAMYGTIDYTPDDWRLYRHAYARLVERVDAQIGSVLDALADAGFADDTVVVYTSDHGDGDASHAWNQKTALIEECVKVPLIVRDPRRPRTVAETSELICVGRDLLPTLAAIATPDAAPAAPRDAAALAPAGPPPDDAASAAPDDAAPDAPLEWRDLLAVAAGAPGHPEVVVETLFERPTGSGTMGRALITDRYKYVVYSWGAHREQLFDLDADPGETRNLAAESAYDSTLEELRARLLAWCLRMGDTGFLKRLALPRDVDQSVHDHIFAIPY